MEHIRIVKTIKNGQTVRFDGQNYLTLLKVGFSAKQNGLATDAATGSLSITGYFDVNAKPELIDVMELSNGYAKNFKNMYNIIEVTITNMIDADELEVTVIQTEGVLSSGGSGGSGATRIVVSSTDDTVKQNGASDYDPETATLKVNLSAVSGGGGTVKTVADVKPDANGNVPLLASNVNAYTKTETDTKISVVAEVANGAKTTADAANIEAASAVTIANTANGTANSAKTIAETAKTTADIANTTANNVKTDLATLTTKVNGVKATITSTDNTVTGTGVYDLTKNAWAFDLQAKSGTAGSYSSTTLVVDNTKNTIDLLVDAAYFKIENKVLKWVGTTPTPTTTTYELEAGNLKGVNNVTTLVQYEDTASQITINTGGVYFGDNSQMDITIPFDLKLAAKAKITVSGTVVNSTATAISIDNAQYDLYAVSATGAITLLATVKDKFSVAAKAYGKVVLSTLNVASLPFAAQNLILRISDFQGIGTRRVALINKLIFTLE